METTEKITEELRFKTSDWDEMLEGVARGKEKGYQLANLNFWGHQFEIKMVREFDPKGKEEK